jgi:large subunit ribosomal protein L22
MNFSASLYHYRVSPRKIRLVADLIRGKRVPEAKDTLMHLTKGSSPMMLKLLESAVANAKQKSPFKDEQLMIQAILVDMAPRLKRYRPRAMGRAAEILKHASHIKITVAPIEKSEKSDKSAKQEKPAKSNSKPETDKKKSAPAEKKPKSSSPKAQS